MHVYLTGGNIFWVIFQQLMKWINSNVIMMYECSLHGNVTWVLMVLFDAFHFHHCQMQQILSYFMYQILFWSFLPNSMCFSCFTWQFFTWTYFMAVMLSFVYFLWYWICYSMGSFSSHSSVWFLFICVVVFFLVFVNGFYYTNIKSRSIYKQFLTPMSFQESFSDQSFSIAWLCSYFI